MLRLSSSLVFVVLALLAQATLAQDTPRRLILKDGSYQLVTKYEVKGNRVRYYSTEREDWEELPNSLVDWPATEKYEKDRVAEASSPAAVQLDKELERTEAPLPEVAPGLRIPEDSGVFLLDNFQSEAQLVEINQTAGDINRDTKINIFKGAINPVAGLKQTIELEGAHAAIQAHVEVPALYVKLDDDATQPGAQLDATRSSEPQKPQRPSSAHPDPSIASSSCTWKSKATSASLAASSAKSAAKSHTNSTPSKRPPPTSTEDGSNSLPPRTSPPANMPWWKWPRRAP